MELDTMSLNLDIPLLALVCHECFLAFHNSCSQRHLELHNVRETDWSLCLNLNQGTFGLLDAIGSDMLASVSCFICSYLLKQRFSVTYLGVDYKMDLENPPLPSFQHESQYI